MLGVTLGRMAWAVVGFCVLAGVVDGRVKVIDEEVGLRRRRGWWWWAISWLGNALVMVRLMGFQD